MGWQFNQSQYGGTGVNNGTSTVTLAANFVTVRAHTLTLTTTNTTNVTLPLTGVLATLANIETFTNKTLSTGSTWAGNLVSPQYGGTGINAASAMDGQVLIGNGTGFTLNTLTRTTTNKLSLQII